MFSFDKAGFCGISTLLFLRLLLGMGDTNLKAGLVDWTADFRQPLSVGQSLPLIGRSYLN